MTTDKEAERIAAGLTEAQRAVMRDGFRDEATAEELARMGLCWRVGAHFTFDPTRYHAGGWKLRPKGHAVRALLQKGETQ